MQYSFLRHSLTSSLKIQAAFFSSQICIRKIVLTLILLMNQKGWGFLNFLFSYLLLSVLASFSAVTASLWLFYCKILHSVAQFCVVLCVVHLAFLFFCFPAETKCEKLRAEALAKVKEGDMFVLVPECRADGSFNPVQCDQRFSVNFANCWCVDENGDKIPGTEVSVGFGQGKPPKCDDKNPEKLHRLIGYRETKLVSQSLFSVHL